MNYRNDFIYFTDKLIARLKDYYGDNYSISISEIIKNNGQIKHSILIRREDESLTPNIYIDDMYDSYLEGETFAQITADIIEFRSKYGRDVELNIEFLDDYELVKSHLGVKLISKDKNEGLLNDVPHTDFSDMAIVYYIVMENEAIGTGTILIRYSLMNNWDITLERLHFDALNNMMRINPPYRCNIVDMLIDLFRDRNNDGTEFAKDEINEYIDSMESSRDESRPLFVLTNHAKMYGASALVYTGMLEELGNSFESDYYVLPSSIHEVLLIPCSADTNGSELTEMVRVVNEESVAQEEVLSDHAYIYHRDSHWLEPIYAE